MITVQQAVKQAHEYFDSLFKDRYSNIILEEIEFNELDGCWYITLGYDIVDTTGEQQNIPVFSGVLVPKIKYRREYKIFKVRGEDGNVLSMKIRSL
jgi:hypothetical protein